MKIKKKYEMPTLEVVECRLSTAVCSGVKTGGIGNNATNPVGPTTPSTDVIF